MVREYNVGIIGYGGFGRFLHNAWKNLPNLEVTAVCDKDTSQDPGGDIKFYSQWEELIQDPRLDIVSIAVPPAFHANIACSAMEAGKNVLIEKPLAITTKEARKIIETRDKTGKTATLNFMQRFNPIAELLRIVSKKRTFGLLRRVDVENYAQDETLPDSHWFWNTQLSGGILVEHAVHFIDLVHYIFPDTITSVTGVVHKRNEKREDRVMANVLYNSGLMATHYHSFALPGFFENTSMRLAFDLARIDLEGWIPLKGRITALVNKESKRELMKLPGLQISNCVKTVDIEDESRPKGWGGALEKDSRNYVKCGGVEYFVEEMIRGVIDIGKLKGEVYSNCLASIMEDLVKAIEDPSHSLRVTLEDGVKAVEVAEKAAKMGRSFL